MSAHWSSKFLATQKTSRPECLEWEILVLTRPSALVFSRQNLAQQERTAEQVADIAKGAYILKDSDGKPELILIATGSEVELAVKAANEIAALRRKRELQAEGREKMTP